MILSKIASQQDKNDEIMKQYKFELNKNLNEEIPHCEEINLMN